MKNMTSQIQQIMKDDKFRETIAFLDKELNKKIDPKDAGQMYIKIISAYIETCNNVNRQYEKTLVDAGEILRETEALQ